MAKVGCFGPARSSLLSELRRRIDSSTGEDMAAPRVWRYNPTAYHLASRRETRMTAIGGFNRYSSCTTIHDLLDFDDNDDSTVSGDLSMAFYEASSVPLGKHLHGDDNEESPAACGFTAFEDIASTARFGSLNSEQPPQENCLAKRATLFPKVTDIIGMESIVSSTTAKRFRHTFQNVKDWLTIPGYQV